MIPGWRAVGHSQAISDFGGVSGETKRWILGGSWSERDKLGREGGRSRNQRGREPEGHLGIQNSSSNCFRVPGAERGAVSTMGSADG